MIAVVNEFTTGAATVACSTGGSSCSGAEVPKQVVSLDTINKNHGGSSFLQHFRKLLHHGCGDMCLQHRRHSCSGMERKRSLADFNSVGTDYASKELTTDAATFACSTGGSSCSGRCSGPPQECRRDIARSGIPAEPLLLCPCGSGPAMQNSK